MSSMLAATKAAVFSPIALTSQSRATTDSPLEHPLLVEKLTQPRPFWGLEA